MDAIGVYEFQVRLTKDKDTGQVVAEVPTLDIADYGADSQQALRLLRKMVAFHLESLMDEGKPIPPEKRAGEGLYLRVTGGR
jgi:predicted RNase H-like HicB family nuclease